MYNILMQRMASIGFCLLLVLTAGCGEKKIIEDPPRPLISWNPPHDFKPAHITVDEDSLFWGLFISRRCSGKDNLWAVSSRDQVTWENPLLIMNAYYAADLEFSVRNDSLHFLFYQIDPNYFWDHGLGIGDFVDNKDELELSFSLRKLTYDRDGDGIPAVVEEELLTSDRLTDTDLDGKPDNLDFNPLSRPRPQSAHHQIYTAVLENILQTSGLGSKTTIKDTAWTKYYGLYVLSEPHPLYLAFPKEQRTFEFADLPVPVISVRTALWFGSRREYYSIYGEIIPHLNFTHISRNTLRNEARVEVETYVSKEKIDNYLFEIARRGQKWEVKRVSLIEAENEKKASADTAGQSQ